MRYSRQMKFFEKSCILKSKDIEKKQISFKNKKIVLVGCGGIGSVFAQLLVRGGFSNLILIDNDIIDETNLQRQAFYESDIGQFKAETLAKILMKIDSKAKIEVINDLLLLDNIVKICNEVDLIIDATDNFETRVLINDFCEKNKQDWIYTGAIRSEIVCCLFIGEKKLFSKVFPKNINDESCCENGVLASTTHAAASIGYNQVLKYFTSFNKDDDIIFVKMNLWNNQIFEIKVK